MNRKNNKNTAIRIADPQNLYIPGFKPFFETKSSFANNGKFKIAAMTSFFVDVRLSSNLSELFVKYRPFVNFRAIQQKL